MEILFVATELAPSLKVGGLADVVFALSKTLRGLGHKVTIALPRYPVFERSGILVARRLTPMPLPPLPGGVASGSGVPREVVLYDGRLPSGVDLVLFDAQGPDGTSLFAGVETEEGEHLYGGASEPLRFSVLCRAATELVRQRAGTDQKFDLVHVHDWPTAMVPYLMRLHPELSATRTVLTIHNLAHQGLFSGEAARVALLALGLGEDHFVPAKLEFYGGVSFLKGGIISADALTTVSETYAREILTPAGGHRLDGVLLSRPVPPLGILNGVDYSVYNPAADPAIPQRYDADDPSNKGSCKSALLAELGLEIAPERPLFMTIGRVVEQKGVDALAEALPRVLKQDLSFLIAGTGEPALVRALESAVSRFSDRARYLGRVSDPLAHRLFAAADFVVMPSRFEPCGLVQVHAQRYGAIPIATKTGGLADTIVDLDPDLETGTGFHLDRPTADDIVGGVGRALAAYAHPRFPALRRRVMRLDLGWERPARRYAQLYKQLTGI
jgi:starch synthase